MNLRNLEQIQEHDSRHRPFPFATLLLAAMAGGALVVAAMTTFAREQAPVVSGADALDRLLAEQPVAPAAAVVNQAQVTFPGRLSDEQSPTTALAAVRDERGRLLANAAPSAKPPTAVSAPGLPSSVLPAGDLLSATAVTRVPKDELTQLTADTLALPPASEGMAPPGQQGGYEIQVASFRSKDDADGFVQELRRRGHRAYRQAAYVPDRGLWHRVRVGSFKSKYQAVRYKNTFEKAERISTFLVDPEKQKRQKSIRDAKAAARERKKKKRTLITAR